MKTQQMTELIAAMTGRKLTLDCGEEIPLDSKVGVYREGLPKESERHYPHFVWKTPKDEDNLIRSFVTCFCSKYREPDPATYFDYSGNPSFGKYAEQWNNPATRADSPCWHHHAGHMLSKEKLKAQIEANFAAFSGPQFSLCFYPTNYGIGIFTLYGGKWVQDSLTLMAEHLKRNAIPYRNEMSKAFWVTRFVIGATKEMHAQILGSLKAA
jgi:hypothetical protein